MTIGCHNCINERECFQYKRNRKSECIDREYHHWEYYETSPNAPDFIKQEEMEIS